jgi:hypothetical protein
MKKLIVFCLTIGLALSAMAQGTIVFKPKASTDVVKYGADCGALAGTYAENTVYTVGLYYRPSGSTTLTLLSTTPIVTSGPLKGAYNGGTLGAPGVTVPAATTIDLQLMVWNASASSYDTATTFRGQSAIFSYKTGDPAASPPAAAGSLAVGANILLSPVPEPTTIALGLLAGGLFLLRRRQ